LIALNPTSTPAEAAAHLTTLSRADSDERVSAMTTARSVEKAESFSAHQE
jgi:hypothetical protein